MTMLTAAAPCPAASRGLCADDYCDGTAPAVPDQADRLEATGERLLALAVKLRRQSIRWNIDACPNVLGVVDHTRGEWQWPATCGARWALQQTRNPAYLYPRVFVCTRIAEHTGRHAAGMTGRVVAVWGDE